MQSLTSDLEQQLSSAPSTEPAYAPSGARVAYAVIDPRQVVVRDLEAETEIYVTMLDEKSREPTWHPDGSRIGFISGVSLRDDVVIQTVDDASRTTIAAGPMEDFERPRISPDGRHILFINDQNDDISGDVVIATIETGDRSTIGGALLGGIRNCSWSPSSDRLACASASGVVVMDLDGANQLSISESVTGALDVRWSPDGQLAAFDDAAPTPLLYIAATDGSELRRLGPGAFAAFSPDGTMLAYTRYSNNRPTEFELFDLESNISAQLLDGAGASYPSWAPCE